MVVEFPVQAGISYCESKNTKPDSIHMTAAAQIETTIAKPKTTYVRNSDPSVRVTE